MAPSDDVPVWLEQPVRGGLAEPRLFGLTGHEQQRAYLKGAGGKPPIAHLTGTDFVEAEAPGSTVFQMPGSAWFLSSQEHISAGALTMLADAALGSAVFGVLPPATGMTTWELSMTFLRPCAAGGVLRATGRILHDARPLALSECWIADANGDPVAHGTSSCFVLPTIEGVPPPEEMPVYVEPVYDTPDPHARPVRGEIIPWEAWREMSGLQILRRQISGELPQPPIHYLTGMTLREASEGAVTFSMPASPWLSNPTGTVQGGATAMLAHAALATAVTTTLEPGSAYRPVDVKVNFFRPAATDGRDLVARGSIVHRGRTLAVASSAIVDADGRTLVSATGSTMITPERT